MGFLGLDFLIKRSRFKEIDFLLDVVDKFVDFLQLFKITFMSSFTKLFLFSYYHLGTLKLLRSVCALKDDFYIRDIIKNNAIDKVFRD